MNFNKENAAPPLQLQTHQHSAMHKPHARNPVANVQQHQQQPQIASGGQERPAPIVATPAQATVVLPSTASSQLPKVYLTSDQIKVQLGKKLDDLDSKYLQHRNLAVTKALAAYDDLVIQTREDCVSKLREAHEVELTRERAAHASSLHALSLALQAAEARCTEMDNERTQTNLAMTELKRKYDMLWTKWKELKVLLASKTAAKNNHQQSNTNNSPLITAAVATTSTSPAPAVGVQSNTSPPIAAVQTPPAAAPTTISQLFADDNEENTPAPVTMTTSPRIVNAESVITVTNRTTIASQDPFASQAHGNGFIHAPAILQSKPMPSLAALIASSASSASSTPVLSTISMNASTSAPVSLAAVLAASEAGIPSPSANSTSNVWKSKKSHTNAQPSQQPQPFLQSTEDATPTVSSGVALAAVRPPSPSLPPLETALGAPAELELPTRIVPAPAPVALATSASVTPSYDPRSRVESIDDDDCIMVATAATSSSYVRKRAHASAISPSRPRSTSPSSSSNTTPQTWKPSSTSNAARKRLRDAVEEKTGTNGPRRSLPPMITGQTSPSPAKKQRPPVPIQPFNSPSITAVPSNAHLPALITAPAASSGVHSPAEQLSDPHSEGLSGLTQRPRPPTDANDASHHIDADGHASRLTQEAKDTVEDLPRASDQSLNVSKPLMSLNAMLAANGNEIPATTVSASKPTARTANVGPAAPLQTPPRPAVPVSNAAQLIDITNSPPDVAAAPRATTSSSSPPISAPAPTPHISTERNREIRETLPGYSCKQCELFYAAVGKGAEHADGRTCEHVSRHRYEFPIALTPEHYWNIGSPESARSFHEESQSRTVTNPNVQRSINAALSTAAAITSPPAAQQPPAATTRAAVTPSPASSSKPTSTIVAAAAVTTMPDYNPTSQELELDQQLYGNNSVSSMTD